MAHVEPLNGVDLRAFTERTLKGRHGLHPQPLFSDDALAELLDAMPREWVHALSMGDDACRPEDNQLALHAHLSGAQLLEAVKQGKLWLNVTRVSRFDARYSALLKELFKELCEQVPGLIVDGQQATLLISSPTAQVYYHADAAPTVLWHLRGRKRLWIYPALDERFLSRRDLEDIFAGVRHEYIPYRPELDAAATVYDLEPGDFATWPQNAPHRVQNLDGLNVSLSSEYFTRQSRRRARTYVANRFFRTRLNLSPKDEGFAAQARSVVQKAAERLGLDRRAVKRHTPALTVDPSAPSGVRPIPAKLTVRVHPSLADLAPLRAQLEALNAKSGAKDPFSTLAFYENYLANDEFFPNGQGMELLFLTAHEGDELRGYLALRRVSENVLGVRAHKVEFLVTHDTDRPHLVCAPEDEERCTSAFYDWLLARTDLFSMLELQQQDDRSVLHRLMPKGQHVYARTFPSMENGTIRTGAFATLADFHKACSKKHRNNVSRSVRQLLGAGRLEHLSSDDPEATPALLDLYATIEPRSWKSRANATITRHERRMAYFRGLLRADQPMRLSIELVMLDGVPIAGLINGAYQGRLYALHIVYDERYAELSPGTLALLLGVRRAIDARCAEYNLLSGFSYYKTRWLADVTPTQSVQLFRVGKPHFYKALLGELRRKVAASAAAKLLHNPVKRAVLDEARPEGLSDAAREQIASLVGKLPLGRVVKLSAEDLRALMPFETREELVRKGA